jgi:hypothetical protein
MVIQITWQYAEIVIVKFKSTSVSLIFTETRLELIGY